MALNPPINSNGIPFRLNNEFVLLERRGMQIEVRVPSMSVLTASGSVYLTTARLIFVNGDFVKDKFRALDMPVAMIGNISFKQPVFGSNYLEFQCRPLMNMLPGTAEVKLWFTEGGCERFLNIFEHVFKQVYEQKGMRRLNDNLLKQWSSGFFNSKAFHDPSDPTVIFTEQPPIIYANKHFDNDVYGNRSRSGFSEKTEGDATERSNRYVDEHLELLSDHRTNKIIGVLHLRQPDSEHTDSGVLLNKDNNRIGSNCNRIATQEEEEALINELNYDMGLMDLRNLPHMNNPRTVIEDQEHQPFYSEYTGPTLQRNNL